MESAAGGDVTSVSLSLSLFSLEADLRGRQSQQRCNVAQARADLLCRQHALPRRTCVAVAQREGGGKRGKRGEGATLVKVLRFALALSSPLSLSLSSCSVNAPLSAVYSVALSTSLRLSLSLSLGERRRERERDPREGSSSSLSFTLPIYPSSASLSLAVNPALSAAIPLTFGPSLPLSPVAQWTTMRMRTATSTFSRGRWRSLAPSENRYVAVQRATGARAIVRERERERERKGRGVCVCVCVVCVFVCV